ncbi:MAG: putative LPS assembly protein LptD [Bacteroidota bacterium]
MFVLLRPVLLVALLAWACSPLSAQDAVAVQDTTADAPLPRPPAPAAQTAPRETDEGPDQPVPFAARDSLVLLFGETEGAQPVTDGDDRTSTDDTSTDDGDTASLFGEAVVRYDDAMLEAAAIDLFFARNEVRARRLAEGDTTGQPRFTQGGEGFTGRELLYNLDTQRGRIVGARTQIQDGFLLGEILKQSNANVLYGADVGYTTCSNPEHVHYALNASRLKVVDQEWVYTGPVQLYLLGIPTPVWLPFGFFPAAEGRRSGPTRVTYGEDRTYGFFIKNMGWYWAVNDYFDAQLTGGLYSKGSYELGTQFNYAKRYYYNGSLRIDYSFLRQGERGDPTGGVNRSGQVGWRHTQDLSPSSRLSGTVNLSSRSYLRGISADLNDNVSQSTSSSVTYTKSWSAGARSLTLNLRANQNFTGLGSTDLTLPSAQFSQRQLFPFRRESRQGRDEAWFEKINLSYTGNLDNRFTFRPDSTIDGFEEASVWEALFDYDAYVRATGNEERFRTTATHRVPIQAAFNVQRLPVLGIPFVLNVTPNFNYRENWFTRSERRFVNEEGRVETESVAGFTAIRTFSTGVGANTQLYGTFPLRVGPLDGFRHIARPSISYTYTPDFSSDFFGYYRSLTDTSGTVVEYPIVSGAGLTDRASQTLSMSVDNTFQTRIARTDSTGVIERTPLQLLRLSANTSYDFERDSLNFSNLSLRASTSIGQALTLNASATYSFYAVTDAGRPINRSHFAATGGLLRPTNYSLSLSTSIGPGGRLQPNEGGPLRGVFDPFPNDPYAEFSHLDDPSFVTYGVPWRTSLTFRYDLTPALGQAPKRERAILNITGLSFQLTPAWRISGSSGYDFIEKEITTSSLNLIRDLHCWEMQFNWVPFGTFKRFGFSIYVKSGQLRDFLKLDVPRSDRSSQLDGVF